MVGLLDGLNDPALMAKIDALREIVLRIAEHYGCTYDDARAWLDHEDAAAAELFAIGNTYPRKLLH